MRVFFVKKVKNQFYPPFSYKYHTYKKYVHFIFVPVVYWNSNFMKKREKSSIYTAYIVLRAFETGTIGIVFGLILLLLLLHGIHH